MDIKYSDISFSIVKTNEISFTPIWSEDGTAYLYTRVFIDIEGILNPKAMAYARPGGTVTQTDGSLPPTSIVALRHALLQPRQTLLVTSPDGASMTPIKVVESPAEGMDVDLNNGPRPLSCVVRNLAGAKTWYISWTCETFIHECASEPDKNVDSPLISNRYSQEDQIDEQWKSTRVTTGVAMFRMDMLANQKKVADQFRAQVLPTVPKGFQRRRINVTAVPNRNALHYQVTDEERMFDLGDTAASGSYITDVDGTYGVTSITTPEGVPGGQSLGQFFIRVRGSKKASNWIMIQRAFRLAAGKLPLGVNGPGVIQQVAITESLVDRDITLNIVYKFVPEQNKVIGAIAEQSLRVDSVFPSFGGDNPAPPWGKGTKGTANLKLLVAALEGACSGAADINVNEQDGQVAGAFQDGPAPEVSVFPSDQLPFFSTKYSNSAVQNPYNEYSAETRYRRNNGILMAPIAGADNSSSTGGFPDPTASFFRIHRPTSTVVVRWKSERIGKGVQVPAPDTYNQNYVLLDHEVIPIGPQIMPDGVTFVYRAEGEYTYGCQHPMANNEKLGYGRIPWIAANFVDLVIDTADYEHGIFDDQSSGGGGSSNDHGFV